MAERSTADEIKYKLNLLFKKKEIYIFFHSSMIDILNSGNIQVVESIINPMLSRLQEKESNSESEEETILKKEAINLNKMVVSLSQENSKLNEQQSIANYQLEILMEKLKEKEIEVNKLHNENRKLKEETQQSRIDDNISGYVESVKNKLNSDDSFFIRMSHIWSGCGAFFCVCAIVAAFFTFKTGIDTLLKDKDLNSISLFYLFTRGLLGIGLLAWFSYICFSNSRRYTHESIRRKDRQHALMFGQIFLQIFGGTASKEDAIHVFKDWNMSGDTAFSGKTEHPPQFMGY